MEMTIYFYNYKLNEWVYILISILFIKFNYMFNA